MICRRDIGEKNRLCMLWSCLFLVEFKLS